MLTTPLIIFYYLYEDFIPWYYVKNFAQLRYMTVSTYMHWGDVPWGSLDFPECLGEISNDLFHTAPQSALHTVCAWNQA